MKNDLKKISLLVALLSLFSVPIKTVDTPTFLAGATIAVALAIYASMPYTCPGCNKYINEGESFIIRPGCPAQHRFHTPPSMPCFNASTICQGCVKDKLAKKRQEAKAYGKKEQDIRKDEREKMALLAIEKLKQEELENYIAQKQREEAERKEQAEKIALQQSAFAAQQEQERENQRLSFQREQDVIKSIDWMMRPCILCPFPLAQKDAGSDVLLDLRKHPKHYVTLPCNKEHTCHRSCLKKWSNISMKCPVPSCGVELTNDQM